MTAKKYAISNPSAAIALRYGANVSRGIGKMDEIIKGQQITIDLLRIKKVITSEQYPQDRKYERSGPSVRGRK